jgi:hypothetical protein
VLINRIASLLGVRTFSDRPDVGSIDAAWGFGAAFAPAFVAVHAEVRREIRRRTRRQALE